MRVEQVQRFILTKKKIFWGEGEFSNCYENVIPWHCTSRGIAYSYANFQIPISRQAARERNVGPLKLSLTYYFTDASFGYSKQYQ